MSFGFDCCCCKILFWIDPETYCRSNMDLLIDYYESVKKAYLDIQEPKLSPQDYNLIFLYKPLRIPDWWDNFQNYFSGNIVLIGEYNNPLSTIFPQINCYNNSVFNDLFSDTCGMSIDSDMLVCGGLPEGSYLIANNINVEDPLMKNEEGKFFYACAAPVSGGTWLAKRNIDSKVILAKNKVGNITYILSGDGDIYDFEGQFGIALPTGADNRPYYNSLCP